VRHVKNATFCHAWCFALKFNADITFDLFCQVGPEKVDVDHRLPEVIPLKFSHKNCFALTFSKVESNNVRSTLEDSQNIVSCDADGLGGLLVPVNDCRYSACSAKTAAHSRACAFVLRCISGLGRDGDDRTHMSSDLALSFKSVKALKMTFNIIPTRL
jgi:hypothetical protein